MSYCIYWQDSGGYFPIITKATLFLENQIKILLGYDNQSEIEKKIQKVSPDLRISGLGLNGNTVTCVIVFLPLRGNRTTIQELKKNGVGMRQKRTYKRY